MSGLVWRRSSFSLEGNCVEVAVVAGGVMVRNSRHPDGAALSFTEAEWVAFVAGARAGEFGT